MTAVPRTCPACLEGNHEAHHYAWNLNRWTGRGAYCPCEGDCVAFLDRAGRMFAAYRNEKMQSNG